MMKVSFAPVSKFLKNNWVITLFSTMIGVFLGLYLTNRNETIKLNHAQEKAFHMVKKELAQNQEALIVYDSLSSITYRRARYVFSNMNQNYELLISRDSIDHFKKQSDGVINNMRVEDYNEEMVQVRGEMNLNVNSKLTLLDLNNIIWNSYKQTDFLNVTNFECVTAVEEVYQYQEKYNELNRRWMNAFTEGVFLKSHEQLKEFMRLWRRVLDMDKLLLKMYTSNRKAISNCS